MSASPTVRPRVASIDALRGLTILVMIFVNDVASVRGAPGWLKHAPQNADAMTLPDWAFPAFLFLVGMALPFSLGRMMEQGVSLRRILAWVAGRTASLLIMGVFMVNAPSREGVLSPNVYSLLLYVFVILAWNATPREPGRRRTVIVGLKVAGAAGLLALAVLYRGPGEPGLIDLRPQWWGILGLIGWAYLVASLAFLATRGRAWALVAVVAGLYGLYVLDRLGAFGWVPLRRWVDFGAALGSHAALSVSGAAFGVLLSPHSSLQNPRRRLMIAVVSGCLVAVAAFVLHQLRVVHPMFIIDKIAATVPWCLWCTAWTLWMWAAISFVMDVKGRVRWAGFLRPAGENPLFAYLLAPACYAVFGLLPGLWGGGDFYFSLGVDTTLGLARSAVFAVAVTWLTGVVREMGVNPRL